jgi:hypothetical protein
VAFAVSQSTSHSAFASTLRPNLTGGAFPRTAGGYSLGTGKAGGRRFFSHGPQSAAQVVGNVSHSMRAFLLQGKRAQYDGTDKQGRKKWRTVTPLQAKAVKKMRAVPTATPGSWVEFGVNPTITAISSLASPLGGVAGYYSDPEDMTTRSRSSSNGSDGVGLQTEGLFDVLQTDFSRALKELALVLGDIQALSALGDLPISYDPRTGRLRIHFPGTDAETVERLARELGVQRGLIGQDAGFDAFVGTEIALMFPFASAPAPALGPQDDAVSESESERLCGRTAYVTGADVGSDVSERANSPNGDDIASTVSSFPDTFDEPSSLSDDSGLELVDLEALEDPWAPGTTRQPRIASQQLLSGIQSPTGSGQTISDLGYSTPSSPSPRSLRRAMYGQRGTGDGETSDGSPLEYSSDFEGLYRFIEMCDQRRA